MITPSQSFADSAAFQLLKEAEQNSDDNSSIEILENLLLRYPDSKEATKGRKLLISIKQKVIGEKVKKSLERNMTDSYSGGDLIDQEIIDELVDLVQNNPNEEGIDSLELSIIGLMTMNNELSTNYSIKKKTDRIDEELKELSEKYKTNRKYEYRARIDELVNERTILISKIPLVIVNNLVSNLKNLSSKNKFSSIYDDVIKKFEKISELLQENQDSVVSYSENAKCIDTQRNINTGYYKDLPVDKPKGIDLIADIEECVKIKSDLEQTIKVNNHEIQMIKFDLAQLMKKAQSIMDGTKP